MNESEYTIRLYTSDFKKFIRISECTLDEAVGFAIVIFDKYAQNPGDSVIVFDETLQEYRRLFSLSNSKRMAVTSLDSKPKV